MFRRLHFRYFSHKNQFSQKYRKIKEILWARKPPYAITNIKNKKQVHTLSQLDCKAKKCFGDYVRRIAEPEPYACNIVPEFIKINVIYVSAQYNKNIMF